MKGQSSCCKNFFVFGILFVGLIWIQSVSAQTAASDIPPELTMMAQELGCVSRAQCAAAFDQNFEKGLEIAEKYKVYDKDPVKKELAQSFKKEVISRLEQAGDENFEEEVIKLASELLKNKPGLARQFGVTSQAVRAAETIASEVKSAGVNINICTQPASSLTREQLESCLNAAQKLSGRKDAVKVYVSEDRLKGVERAGGVSDFQKALDRGEYSEVGKTPDEIGVICLRPGSPAVCDEIAKRFFGEDGARTLSEARQEVVKVENRYKKAVESFTFTTPDGRTITGRDAIRGTCDTAFQNRDLGLAKACGNFAVKNGFVSQVEVERGLTLLESVAREPVNFDDCRNNPDACERFIPEAERGDFRVMRQIDEIMRAEIGFDPFRCEEGRFNQEIGQKCLEGSRRALPRLEAIAGQSFEARRIVAEIKGHIEEGERFSSKAREFEQVFQVAGGPGGCRSPEECFKYCSDPAHGPECISFGAKQGVFTGQEAVSRFEQYNQRLEQPAIFVTPQTVKQRSEGVPYSFPGQGPYPGFQPPGQGGIPPGQYPGFTQPGPGYYPDSYYPGPGPVGPSPECFAALQSGDFLKAKQICSVPQTVYYPQPRPTVCPALPTVDTCPAGQRKIVSWSSPECGTYYNCVPEGTQPPSPGPYPYPGDDACRELESLIPGCHSMFESPNARFDSSMTRYVLVGTRTVKECATDRIAGCSNYNYPYPTPTPYPPSSSCDQSLIAVLGSGCHQMFTDSSGNSIYCDGPMSKSAKRGDTSATSGCSGPGYPGGQTPTGQREQTWNSLGLRSWIRADADTARIESLKQACVNVPSSSNVWTPDAGNSNSVDFGMPNADKCQRAGACASGQYFDGANCTASGTGTYPGGGSQTCDSSLINLLGSGCHYMYNDSSGNRTYCDGPMTKSAKYGDTVTTPSCSSPGTGTGGSGYPGDANSCPGFSYSRWDSTGRRYCQLNNERRCDYNYPSYLTNGGNYTATNCPASDSTYPGGGGSGQCDWTTQYWKSSTSSCQPKSNCTDSANPEYNTSECYGVRSSGTGSTTYGSCTNELISLLGSGCHNMGNAWFNSAMTSYVLPGTTAVKDCATNYLYSCSSGGTGTTCPSGQWWDGATSRCTSTSSCGSGQWWDPATQSCRPSTTSGSQCPSFAHEMAGYCMLNNDTSRCAEYSSASSETNYTNSVCQAHGSGSTTSCPSGQYWSGSSCVSSTTTSSCPTGYHSMGGGYCMSDSDPNTCQPSGGGATYSCSGSTGGSQTCPSGQYWYVPPSGGAGYCQSTSTTTCPSGQYWNGTSCVSSTTTSCPSDQWWDSATQTCRSSTTTTCPSGQYWYVPPSGGAGYCQSTSTTTCPSDQYWNGTSCVSSTSGGGTTTDPATACAGSGGTWNGSTCQFPSSSTTSTAAPLAHYFAEVNTLFSRLIPMVNNFFRR
ncbi:hypothetical protein HYV91_00545 [Candidatus Wolfebacteria bacterium]|nr:hypothetical protein [Candidatus Wolfebacteria bacterium]